MAPEFTIPAHVTGAAELARLQRELEAFDEAAHQAELRRKSGADEADPVAGHQLRMLAEANNCDLLQADQRTRLTETIATTLTSAPTVTLSFASDPSSDFTAKITTWFRQSVHPQTLVRIGLQPDIAAGFMLRTPNKQYDFSLRGRFKEQRTLLIERIRGGGQVS